MDVLVVAPRAANLPDASVEVAAIERYHNATIVPQPVRDSDIAAAIENGPYDIIWFITHGTLDGVLLGNGEHLSIDGVGTYIKTSGAKLCVLNTCESEQVATEIISGGEADIICTIAPVENRDAIRLGRLLAKALTENEDYRFAYDAVATDRSLYRYLRVKAIEQNFRRKMDPNDLPSYEVRRLLRGNEDEEGLVKTVRRHEREIASLKDEIEKMRLSIELIKPPGTGKVYINASTLFWGMVGLSVLALAFLVLMIYLLLYGWNVNERVTLYSLFDYQNHSLYCAWLYWAQNKNALVAMV